MASSRGNQGGGSGRGSSERGFAGMDDAQQREIARKGGEASARAQGRDEQGRFDGSRSKGGSSSSSSGRGGGNQGGSRGGSNR